MALALIPISWLDSVTDAVQDEGGDPGRAFVENAPFRRR